MISCVSSLLFVVRHYRDCPSSADSDACRKWIQHVATNENYRLAGSLIDPRELEVLAHIRWEMVKKGIMPHGRPFPSEGVVLAGPDAHQAIKALKNPSLFAIQGVPVDERVGCKDLLKYSLSRPISGASGKVDLLCNSGFTGSGKSTLQAFNFEWFRELTRGIAIEVTFNRDQVGVPAVRGVKDGSEFLSAIGLKIMHRALEYLFGGRKVAREMVTFDKKFLRLFSELPNPLTSSLTIVRRLLNANNDSIPILLGVDDLVRAYIEGSRYTPYQMLSSLGFTMDEDTSLFLSIAAYRAEDIGDVTTYSKRFLLLQSLPPLWHNVSGFNQASIDLLPASLQAFFDAELRQHLPYQNITQKNVFSDLSELLQVTGGHPRRIERFLRKMNECTGAVGALHELKSNRNKRSGEKYINVLHDWLTVNTDSIKSSIKMVVNFPKEFDPLVNAVYKGSKSLKDKSIVLEESIEAFEHIARLCADPFPIKDDVGTAGVNVVLEGSSRGYCQVINVGDNNALAFVPMAVLQTLESELDQLSLLPCGDALVSLRSAIVDYLKVPNRGDEEKALESVLAHSVLLYTRSNVLFSPGALCHPHLCGEDLKAYSPLLPPYSAHGGSDILMLKNVTNFPPMHFGNMRNVTGEGLRELVSLVTEQGANGAIIVPQHQLNLMGGVYGLFKRGKGVNDWVLISFQCKDWFTDDVWDRVSKLTVIESWKKYRHEIFPENFVKFSDKNGVEGSVHILHILFTANEIASSQVKLSPNEGVSSLMAMRNWLPTAAYASQSAMSLRSVFVKAKMTSDESDN